MAGPREERTRRSSAARWDSRCWSLFCRRSRTTPDDHRARGAAISTFLRSQRRGRER